MATSGTIGATTFTVATLIEKAYRRCNILPGLVTPELIDIAKENLALILYRFSTKGVKLWCVEKALVGIQTNKATYTLPVGTIDILNAYFRQITQVDASEFSATTTQKIYALDTAVVVTLIGFKVDATVTGITVAGSADNVTYTDLTTSSETFTANTWYWLELDGSFTAEYWRLTFGASATIVDIVLSTSYTDLPISRQNIDDFHSIPVKTATGFPATNYWIDRQIAPNVTIWPVPNSELGCLSLITHREVQDVGVLTNTLEVPNRWLDAILWALASMCAVEIPTVPADRISLCIENAASSLDIAEAEERDTAPSYLRPNISVYNV